MKSLFFAIAILIPFYVFSQDSSVVAPYRNWDFVKKQEKRIWSIDACYLFPVGAAAGLVNENAAGSAYFFNYASKKQCPVHFNNGLGLGVFRKCIIARTYNGKLAYGEIINPLFIDFVQYDFKGNGREPQISSSELRPFLRFGSGAGGNMTYRLGTHMEAEVFLLFSVTGESVNGKVKFAEPVQFGGNPINEVDYSFAGMGTLWNEGISFRFYKLVLGIENYSSISYGKYYFRNKLQASGQMQDGGTYDLNSVFKTEQMRFTLGYAF